MSIDINIVLTHIGDDQANMASDNDFCDSHLKAKDGVRSVVTTASKDGINIMHSSVFTSHILTVKNVVMFLVWVGMKTKANISVQKQ